MTIKIIQIFILEANEKIESVFQLSIKLFQKYLDFRIASRDLLSNLVATSHM